MKGVKLMFRNMGFKKPILLRNCVELLTLSRELFLKIGDYSNVKRKHIR